MKTLLSLLVLLALLLSACAASTLVAPLPAGTTPPPEITVKNFPRLDASTSAEPILAMIACHFLHASCSWNEWFTGERRMVVDVTNLPEGMPGFQASGTHQAYVSLIDGQADLIVVARAPSDLEHALAAGAGVALDVRPVALDAFVFIVNDENPVEELTTEEIRSIYTGAITDWSSLGAPAGEIHPYQRDENSGSQELMEQLVMQGREMVAAPDMMLLWSMFAPFNAITDDLLGIGYSVYYYEENMAPSVERVKPVAVDGVFPDPQSIAAHQYPYVTEVYVVIRQGLPAASLVTQLRSWLLSPDGQALIASSGYVPLP